MSISRCQLCGGPREEGDPVVYCRDCRTPKPGGINPGSPKYARAFDHPEEDLTDG